MFSWRCSLPRCLVLLRAFPPAFQLYQPTDSTSPTQVVAISRAFAVSFRKTHVLRMDPHTYLVPIPLTNSPDSTNSTNPTHSPHLYPLRPCRCASRAAHVFLSFCLCPRILGWVSFCHAYGLRAYATLMAPWLHSIDARLTDYTVMSFCMCIIALM